MKACLSRDEQKLSVNQYNKQIPRNPLEDYLDRN